MGLFEFLDASLKQQAQQKKKRNDPSFRFDWLHADYKDPLQSARKQKTAHKHEESYSSDEEADEDGFFDENL